MVDDLIREFSYLTKDKGYSLQIEQITYVFEKIIFSKENIEIIFEYELMNSQFDFEIHVLSGNYEYSICEYTGRCRLFYENKGNVNIIHKNVFEYTNNFWNESIFQKKKEEIHKLNFLLNRKHKKFIQMLSLYKELLSDAIANIESSIIP